MSLGFYRFYRRLFACLLLVSIFFIQLTVSPASAQTLWADSKNSGVSAFIRAMDISNENSLAMTEKNRLRNRTLDLFDFTTIFKRCVERVDLVLLSAKFVSMFDIWDLLIGQELAALPQADMVALK